MDSTYSKITHEGADVTIADRVFDGDKIDAEIADWAQEVNRQEAERTAEMLSGLLGAAQEARSEQEHVVTLASLSTVLGIDRSGLRKFIKKQNYPHRYRRVLDRVGARQRQMVFTQQEAEQIIKGYYKSTI